MSSKAKEIPVFGLRRSMTAAERVYTAEAVAKLDGHTDSVKERLLAEIVDPPPVSKATTLEDRKSVV